MPRDGELKQRKKDILLSVKTQLADNSSSKPLNKRKLSMPSANKYYKPRKKNGRVVEVPLAHAIAATESHLRALSIINDDEDVQLEFTPDMVRINIQKGKGTAGTA